jgi:hypothetical protein
VGRAVSSALGGGAWATNISTIVLPAITAFVTLPVPHGIHRVRRIALVLGLAGVVTMCRRTLAAIHLPRSERRDLRAETLGTPGPAGVTVGHNSIGAATAQLTHAWLGQVALTTAISLAPVAVAVAAQEAFRAREASASAPSLHVPDDVIARAGNHAATRVTYHVTATSDDNKPLTPTCRPPSGALFALGKTNVSCSVIDATGKNADAQFAVTVLPGGDPRPQDRTPPTLTVPADFSREATTAEGVHATYAATARDDRDGAITPDCRPISGSLFTLGRTRVTCTVTNTAERTTRRGFTITVTPQTVGPDRTKPVINVPDPITAAATSKDGATVRYTASASDDRDGPLKPDCHPASGATFPIGTTTVSCATHDSAGNDAKQKTFTVTVTDTREPAPPPNKGSQLPSQSPPAPPTSPRSSPFDLTGSWHLVENRTNFGGINQGVDDAYTTVLHRLDDRRCAEWQQDAPCYTGRFFRVLNKTCIAADFVYTATGSGTGLALSGTAYDYPPPYGPQRWVGTGVKDPSTHFTGTITQVTPDIERRGTFSFTRCDDHTPADYCLVPPPGC